MKKLLLAIALVLVSFSVFACDSEQATVDLVMTKERSAVEPSVAKSDVVEPVMNGSGVYDLPAASVSIEEDVYATATAPVIACECVCPTSNIVEDNFFHSEGHYTIVVDYSKKIEDLLVEGKYSFIDEYLLSKDLWWENEKRNSTLSVELIHFNNSMIDGSFLASYLKEKGLRPATMREALAFAAAYPDVQREYRIAAGSISSFNPRVVFSGNGDDRRIIFHKGDWWDWYFRFLVVRE